jgi:hypothetical protein
MFDAYKVAVKLTLVNHVSAGLISISQQLNKLHPELSKAQRGANGLRKELEGIKKLGFIGGAMAGLGLGGLALFKAPLEEAKKWDQAVGKFRLFGLSDAVNNEATAYAKAMNVMGSSATENMKLITEAQGVFRESGLSGSQALDGAKLAAPMLAKIKFATASLDDDSKSVMHTSSMAMLRFVEMRGGLKDAKTFNAIADDGWRAIQSSGGNINWEQLRQFMTRGGVAAMGLTNKSLFGELEPIIGALKGSTAGDAWMTSYNRLTGGVRIPNQVAHMLTESGVWDPKKIEWNSQGGIKHITGNPLKDMSTFGSAPVTFYEKDILPMYAKMNGGKGLNSEERARENLIIFGRNGAKMFTLIDKQIDAIHRSVDAQAKALDVSQSVADAAKTLVGKEIDLEAKWTDAKRELGMTVLPMAIAGVEKLTKALKEFTDFAQENRTTVRRLTLAFVGLSAAMAFGGAVNILSAGFKGLRLAVTAVNAAGGAGGLVGMGARLAGVGTGLSAVGGATGLATLGASLAALAGGIGILYGVTKAMSWVLENIIDPDTDPENHPGMRRKHLRGRADVWEVDSKLPQGHAGMHFQRAGRGGTWVKDSTVVAKIPGTVDLGASVPTSSSGRYRMGVARGSVVPPPPNANITVKAELHVDGRKMAEVTTKYQAQDMARPQRGPSTFDSSMNLAPVGLGFAGA